MQLASLAKFTISPAGFEHSAGFEKFESQNCKKIKFLHSYFIFVTYLLREVDGKVITQRNPLESPQFKYPIKEEQWQLNCDTSPFRGKSSSKNI